MVEDGGLARGEAPGEPKWSRRENGRWEIELKIGGEGRNGDAQSWDLVVESRILPWRESQCRSVAESHSPRRGMQCEEDCCVGR